MNRGMQILQKSQSTAVDDPEDEDTGECWKITNLSQPNTPHFCRSCMLGFRDRILLNNHLKLHYIGSQDITETTVITKEPEHSSPQVYGCLNCKEHFHSPTQLKIHSEACRVTEELISWQCNICEDVFDDKELLQSHFANVHSEHTVIQEPDSVPIECPQCQLVFDNHEDLKIHIEIDHEPDTPPKNYRGKGKSQEVYITVACECGKVFMNELDYQEHMMVEHPDLVPIKWPKDVSEIKKRRRRSSVTQLPPPRKRHMPSEYNPMPRRPIGRPPREDNIPYSRKDDNIPYSRKEDNIPFSRREDNISYPLYREPAEDPGGSCVECGETFTKIVELKRHMQTIHQHLKPYACSLCNRRFTRKSDVKRHIETIHGQAVSQDDLDRIQAIRPFRCAKCGNPFGRYSDIRKHIEVHHGLPFSPDTYIYQLEHMNEAGLTIGTSGEQVTIRTYDCGLCKRKYRNKTTVRHHIRKDHNQEDPDAFITRTNMTQSEDVECQFCGDVFNCVEEKIEHVQSIHQMVEECSDMVEDVRLASVLEQDILRRGDVDDDDCLMPVKDVSTPEKRRHTKMSNNNQIVILKQEVVNSSSSSHPPPLEHQHEKKDNSWCQSLMYDIVSENTTILKEKADYDCPECSRSFTRPKSLQQHIQKMHSRKLLEFECDLCGKSYKQQAQFVKHLQIAHPEVGPKPETSQGYKPKSNQNKDNSNNPDKVYRRERDQVTLQNTEQVYRREREQATLQNTDHHSSKQQKQHTNHSNHGNHGIRQMGGVQPIAVPADVPLMEYYTCTLCSAMFSSTESLQRHMNMKHKDAVINTMRRKSVLPSDHDAVINHLNKTDDSLNHSSHLAHDVSIEYT